METVYLKGKFGYIVIAAWELLYNNFEWPQLVYHKNGIQFTFGDGLMWAL